MELVPIVQALAFEKAQVTDFNDQSAEFRSDGAEPSNPKAGGIGAVGFRQERAPRMRGELPEQDLPTVGEIATDPENLRSIRLASNPPLSLRWYPDAPQPAQRSPAPCRVI